MGWKFEVDSTGKLVRRNIFPAQAPPVRNQATSPLGRLDRILKKEEQVKILVERSRGGIGDVLMTIPTIRVIKEKYKGIVDYATDPNYLDGSLIGVLGGCPYIDNILDYRTVDKTEYTATVNLTCPCVAHEVPGAIPINRIDLFARGAGIEIPIKNPSLYYKVFNEEKKWADDWLNYRQLKGKKLIVVQPNSSTKRRDLPPVILQRALVNLSRSRRDTRIVVIVHDYNNDPRINWKTENVELSSNNSIRQNAALIEQADLVLCQDSATLHLASALRKRTLAFFGPTDPRARVNYHPEALAIWFGYEFSCGPCWYNTNCRSNYACWHRITSELVMETTLAMLEDQPQLPDRHEYIHYGNYIKGRKSARASISASTGLYEVL